MSSTLVNPPSPPPQPTAEPPTAVPPTAVPPKPLTSGAQGPLILFALWAFVTIPFVALVAAVPVAWGWGLNGLDIAVAATMYIFSGIGIGTGFHRYLTHGSFKAHRWLRILLTVAGTTAIEGSPIQWVADHRRHHAFSDREGDPHSPWRYGTGVWGLTKGLCYAHVGWLFRRQLTNQERFAPDLLADRDIRRIDRLFPVILTASVFLPAAFCGLVAGSWSAALTGLFWAGLVRIALLHHVTWSINSICHVYGERPFETRDGDRASNFWPLALLSFGESWHNSHHAEPTLARHGVDPGQIDINARLIWAFERFGWAWDVRWPSRERLDAKRRPTPRQPAHAGTMSQ